MPSTPIQHLTQEDFGLIPLLNTVAEPVAGSVTPSSANVGRWYRNTSTNRLELVVSSSSVLSIPNSGTIADADIAAAAGIQLSKLATNPLARANHTGTQTASTVSDFDTQVRTSRLDQMAAPTSAVNLNSQRATGAADPTGPTDLTNQQYVLAQISAALTQRDWKDGARVALTSNVSLTAPGATLDGASMGVGDRVLLTGQTDATQNGLYTWQSTTSLVRATDADTSAEVTQGMSVPIAEGTNPGFAILTTSGTITLGTTALSFSLIKGSTYTQGTGISISGIVISLAVPVAVANGGTGSTTAAGARTNLGVARKGGNFAVPTLAAGVESDITHSLGTTNATLQVRRLSDNAVVSIGMRAKDANTVSVTSAMAVSSGTLELLVNPVD